MVLGLWEIPIELIAWANECSSIVQSSSLDGQSSPLVMVAETPVQQPTVTADAEHELRLAQGLQIRLLMVEQGLPSVVVLDHWHKQDVADLDAARK